MAPHASLVPATIHETFGRSLVDDTARDETMRRLSPVLFRCWDDRGARQRYVGQLPRFATHCQRLNNLLKDVWHHIAAGKCLQRPRSPVYCTLTLHLGLDVPLFPVLPER